MQTLIEQLIDDLSLQQSRGVKAVSLSPENIAFLKGEIALTTTLSVSASEAVIAKIEIQENPVKVQETIPQEPAQEEIKTETFRSDIAEVVKQFSGKWEYIFNEGAENAELMFIVDSLIDEHGGILAHEDGTMLAKMITAMGFTTETVSVMNLSVNAAREQGDKLEDFIGVEIEARIAEVSPKVIVLFGGLPLKRLMKQRGISKLRGQWMKYKQIDVMPTLHPAYLKRKPEEKSLAWADLQQVMAKLGKTQK